MANFAYSYVLTAMAVAMLALSGCAGKKGLVRESISANASDDEKKEFALKLFKQGAEVLFTDNQTALARFDQAREVDPTLIAAHFNAGVALEAQGQLPEAILRYEACLAVSKDEANCLDNLIVAMAKLGQVDEAAAKVEQYLNEAPEAPFAMVAAAKLALVRKDYARAERYARMAIERDAENVEALFVMATVFYERAQYPAAKWTLKNALEVAPSHGGLHLLLGHTDMALNLMHDALDSYALAVKAQPTDEALESYGLLLLKRGRVADALPVLKRLVELYPDDARNHLHLGNAYLANKMFDEAKASYLVVLEKNPEDGEANFNLGLLYFDMKPKGMAELDRLKTAKTYFEAFLQKAGQAKSRQEQVKEAKDYLRTLAQKIEMEEYAAESAKAFQEETPPSDEEKDLEPGEEQLPQEKGSDEPAVDMKGLDDEDAAIKDEKASTKAVEPAPEQKNADVREEKASDVNSKAKDEKSKTKKKPEPDLLDGGDEADDFFDDL